MSSIAWIDFDETERQRAQRIMELFQERETRDELGLGAIRDSIADHFFPGTSTIQTRLRYMLFIPWLFRSLEQRTLSVARLRAEARQLELDFITALKHGDETSGVFGIDAGGRLQRLPSSVYWAGLGAWGIRKFPGSIDSLFVTLHGRPRARLNGNSEDAAAVGRAPAIWSEALPDQPIGFPDKAVFRLSREEAQFIIDRLIATQPVALLTFLARRAIVADCDFIWSHPQLAEFPAAQRRLVLHSQIFSSVMQGAALLYNLALSELRNSNKLIEEHRGRLQAWREELDLAAARAWSLDDFWQATAHPAHRIPELAKRFVVAWRDLVLETQGDVASSDVARQLVEQRERRLKTGQSRYTNHAVRDRWGGRSGVERLGFRWGQAKSHLRDLAHAE